MVNQDWSQDLVRLGACQPAIDWCRGEGDYSGGPKFASLEEAWLVCTKLDWMLWLAARASNITHQQIVLAACAFARLSLHLVPVGENRPRICIEAAEAWANGKASLEEVEIARRECRRCYDQYYWEVASGVAASAAYAAAAAEEAGAAVAGRPAAAAAAARRTSAAAGVVAGAAVYGSPEYHIIRDQVYAQCVDLCRQLLPLPEIRVAK